MSGPVTLSDVARVAGVSLATASRAINGSATRTVRSELREKVLAAAAELQYAPNANAQAMARGQTTALGLIVHDRSEERRVGKEAATADGQSDGNYKNVTE